MVSLGRDRFVVFGLVSHRRNIGYRGKCVFCTYRGIRRINMARLPGRGEEVVRNPLGVGD
jgi:hypothetical protein